MLRGQTIPNSSFENWISQGSYENPTGDWLTVNEYCTQPFPEYGVSKTTDCVDGQYAAKLVSGICNVPGMGYDTTAWLGTGVFSNGKPIWGFPCNQKISTLNFYYKYFPVNNLRKDTARIFIQIQKWNTTTKQRDNIGEGFLKLVDSVPNYTQGIININYYASDAIPDTASIDITSSLSGLSMEESSKTPFIQLIGSTLYIDKLEFGANTKISNESISTGFILYPNPASDNINLDFNNITNDAIEFKIYNVLGVLVKSEMLQQNRQLINIGNLSSGLYTVVIKSKNLLGNQRLIIKK
jgi:Secretion system C-terminal sorting domain